MNDNSDPVLWWLDVLMEALCLVAVFAGLILALFLWSVAAPTSPEHPAPIEAHP